MIYLNKNQQSIADKIFGYIGLGVVFFVLLWLILFIGEWFFKLINLSFEQILTLLLLLQIAGYYSLGQKIKNHKKSD